MRGSPTAYSDGAYEMAGKNRPSPMDISSEVHSDQSGQASMFARNSLQAFYGKKDCLYNYCLTYISFCFQASGVQLLQIWFIVLRYFG